MSCDVVQRTLLNLARPDQPPTAVQSHLAQCPACLACQQRLVKLERQLPLLPVPPSSTKDAFLRRVLNEPAEVPAGVPRRPRGSHGWMVRERARRKLAFAAALAAALVLVAVGWAVWYYELARQGPSVKALVAKLHQQGESQLAEDLARARTPRERVETLAKAAEHVFARSKTRTAGVNRELATLASLYGELVRDGLVRQAESLPVDERAEVLVPIRERLAQTQRDAELLAKDQPTDIADPLQLIAAAAGDGEDRLGALIAAAAMSTDCKLRIANCRLVIDRRGDA